MYLILFDGIRLKIRSRRRSQVRLLLLASPFIALLHRLLREDENVQETQKVFTRLSK